MAGANANDDKPRTDEQTIRLIVDKPAAGPWNMSVDQALLQAADDLGQITLRWYQWQSPTLSLGYFQKAADREAHVASRDCEIVRRASGGGAILHDHELTYCLCVPSKSRWSSKNSMLYTMVHQAIIASLKQRDVHAALYADGAQNSAGDKNAFLCFQRRTPGDIVLADHKVVGSAQRRLKNAVLQHGSILIEKSKHASELPGIEELSEQTIATDELIKETSEYIAGQLSLEIVESKIGQAEIELAQKIEIEKFGHHDWTFNR